MKVINNVFVLLDFEKKTDRYISDNSSIILITKAANSSILKTQMTTRLKPIPKVQQDLTTVKLISALPITTNMTPVNSTKT